MERRAKLKPNFNFSGILVPAAVILLALFAYFLIGIRAAIFVVFLVFLLYSVFSLFAYLRTRNISYVAASIFQLFIALYMATVPIGIIPFENKKVSIFFYLCGLSVAIWLIYLAINRKARWKGREVFELAARAISDSSNGFTERPRPAGKISYTHSELMGFADYLRRNLICWPYFEENAVVFVPVGMSEEYGFLLGTTDHYHRKTWISFDMQGNVSVNIAKADYNNYVDELSFDQLCESMGDLFIQFMEYYKKGDETRILTRLNSLKLSMFS